MTKLIRWQLALLLATGGLLILLTYLAVPWGKMRTRELSLSQLTSMLGINLPPSAALVDSSYVELPKLHLTARVSIHRADLSSLVHPIAGREWKKGVHPYVAALMRRGWWLGGDAKQKVWYVSYERPHPDLPRMRNQGVVVDMVAAERDTSTVIIYIEANTD